MNLARLSTRSGGGALLSLGLCLPASAAAASPAGTDGSEPVQKMAQAVPPAPAPGADETKPGADEANQPSESERIEALEKRVKELELAKPRQEQAIRSIIRSSLAGTGSRINEYVSLGGSLEVGLSQRSDFSGEHKGAISLDTAEVDLEIKANDWVSGNFTLSYQSATSILFPTTPSFNTGVDRFTADKAFLTIGDIQKFPLFASAGLKYLEFGSSSGVHRVDVLSLANPLTVEAFELRNPAIGIGFGLPTPVLKPPEPPITIPQVRPLILSPMVDWVAHALGYQPAPRRPKPLPQYTPPPEAPAFYGIFNIYDPNGVDLPNRSLGSGRSGRLGYRSRGNCGHTYPELTSSLVCPWSVNINVDYDNSIFDSRFLQSEYQPFLQKIGNVSALAGTIKATLGPWLLVGEWNGATKAASFVDDAGKMRHIRPAAWQISVGYQFDWNPWVEVIGEQGDFVSVGYSQSHNLSGVSKLSGTTLSRVGFVPRNRLTLTAGEWVLENTKLAIEYSRDSDYQKDQGGTGMRANEYVAAITYNF